MLIYTINAFIALIVGELCILPNSILASDITVDQNIQVNGPSVDKAQNGVTIINLARPNDNGVSHNKFENYNVNFTLNSNQEIVNAEGYRVLGAGNVPLVKIDDELPLTISTDGTVYNGDQEIGLLAIVDFDNKNLLRKQAGTLFVAPENANQVPFTGRIHQGSLETSNINIVQEMVNLISSYRAYEINSKAVQSQDQITDRAINEVAKG